MGEANTLDVAIKALDEKLEGVTKKVQDFGTDLQEKLRVGGEVTQEVKDKVDQALSEQGVLREAIEELKGRAQNLEQKTARRGADEAAASMMTPGQLFTANERVVEFLALGTRNRGRVRVDLDSITQRAALTTGGLTNIVAPDRVAGISPLPERRMTVRDLLTPGRTMSGSIQYWKETGFTNNADAVSEGTAKPTSTIAGELVTANVSTIAHIMIASKQVMEDVPALQSHIDGRLRYGLAYEEEVELLLGDGSGTQLLGLVPQATAFSQAFQPEFMQRIDFMRLALLQAELALFPATGLVTHPTDWARIELTKDAEGRYIFSNVQNEGTPRMWGRPVVATPAMTETKFLAGAFRLGAQIFDREDANVEISTEDSDNFQKNLITIRGEERLALAVYRPEAFIYGTFQATT